MEPIQNLLRKNVKFEWMETCEQAFKNVKKTLSENPMLYHPDPNKPWILETDASKTAYAGILLQPHERNGTIQEVPVTFTSFNFTATQRAWSATERELYAVFVAFRKFVYLI